MPAKPDEQRVVQDRASALGGPFAPSGLFADADREMAYVLANWAEIRDRLRDIGLYGSAAFLLAGVVDFMVLGPAPMFWLVALGRLLVGGFGVLVVRRGMQAELAPDKLPALRMQLFLFELLTIPTLLLEFWAVPMAPGFPTMGALTLVFALYAFAPLLCRKSLWLGPLLSLPFMGMLMDMRHAEPVFIVGALIVLGFANLAGWRVAVSQARNLRLAWLDRESLRLEIAERRLIENALQDSETHVRRLFEAAPVAMLLLRLHDGAILRANQAASDLLDPAGWARRPLLSLDFYADPQRREALRTQLLAGQALRQIEIQLRNTQGLLLDTLVSAQPIAHEGQACVLVGITDISGLKALQRDLQEQAEQDVLTGLPNRRGFVAQTHAVLEKPGEPLALLLIDLDHFKRINDTYGHHVGDEMLEQFGAALLTQMRHGDIVARYGGEEFVALLAVATGADAVDAAERLRGYIEQHPFATSAGVLRLSVSIGLALRESGEGSPSRLGDVLRAADDAIYRDKQGGRNRVELQTVGV